MPFGRSKSLRAKRSSRVRPSKEAMAPGPRRSVYSPPADPPAGDFSELRTSMIFPDGPPDPIPTPKAAISSEGVHLIRSNPEMRSGGPEAALERLERSMTADDASHAASYRQAAIQPFATKQLTSPQNLDTFIQKTGDGDDEEEPLIGVALGDPEQDLGLTANEEDAVHPCLSDRTEQSTMTTTEGPSTAAHKVLEDGDPSTMPTTREQATVAPDPLHSEEPSITSSSPMPHSDRQKEALRLDDVNKPLKRKPSRWNKLGGWFGKKSVPSAAATTQIYQMQDQPKALSHHEENALIGTTPLGVDPKGKDRNHRSRSSSTRLTKSKGGTRPTFRRTRTTPSPHPPGHDPNPSSKESNADDTFPNLRLDDRPMLSVDIPDIQLDRYSVMFGGLLQPKPPPPAQPSLLVRRHGHLEKVRLDGHDRESTQEALPKHTRRATSPSYIKSPSLFSLFPSTPTQPSRTQAASNTAFKPSPLRRSNTTPGALSPIRQIFETPEPPDRSPAFLPKHAQAQVQDSYPTEPPARDDAPNQVSEGEDPPFFTPPHSPPHLTPTPSPHPNTPTPTPTPTPSLVYTNSPPVLATNTTTPPTATPTISIARQFSITRRQRQFHVPFVPDDAERLVDRRPMTPTVVNVRSRSSSASGAEPRLGPGLGHGYGRGRGHGSGDGVGHVGRKSQRGVVECVEG